MSIPVKEMKVYVTAIWWTDCDPFVRIIGNSADAVRKAADKAMRDAVNDAYDSDDPTNCDPQGANEIHWNGIGSMNLKDVIAAYEIPSLQPDYEYLISGDKDALLFVIN